MTQSAAAYFDPITNPRAWDAIVLGTTVSPGYCKLKGWKRVHEFDVKKGKGTLGATVTFTQKPPVEGTIEFYLWDNGTLGTGHNHFQEWSQFFPLLKYDPTKKVPQAINLWHQALSDINVSSVVCTNIGALEPEGSGMWKVTCSFLEYFPPSKKSAVGTPTTSTDGPPGNPPGTPPGTPPVVDPEQAEIARLMALATAP